MLSENKTITFLSVLAAVLFVFAFFMVIFYAPIEVNMGLVQKVFYFHMSAAWVGMLAFLMAAVFGILYLVHKDLKWDRLLASSVEIGLLFTVICILSGMIWARPIWNTGDLDRVDLSPSWHSPILPYSSVWTNPPKGHNLVQFMPLLGLLPYHLPFFQPDFCAPFTQSFLAPAK